MAQVRRDFVAETSTTTGTGARVLGGASAPARTFSSVCADNDLVEVAVAHATLNEWEVSLARYSSGGNSLTPVQVRASSNAGAVVNFSAGTKSVELVVPAVERQVCFSAELDFGFVGDLVTTFDGAGTAAGSTIDSATAAFTTNAVIGQRITLAGAGASGALYVGTITAINSATQVAVTPTIGTTVSNRGLSFGTDNTAAITAMQTAVNNSFSGARVVFGPSKTNSYGFPTRVVFNKPAQLEGQGGGHNADSGDYTRQGGTRLCWWAATSDSGVPFSAFIEFAPTGVQALKAVALRSLWIDCRNGDQRGAQALIGLRLLSCHGFVLHDVYINDAAAVGLWTDIASSPSEAKDCTRFLVSMYRGRQLDNPPSAVTTPITTSSAVTLTTTPQNLTVAANTLPAAGYVWVATSVGYPQLVRYTGGGGTTTLTGCVISADVVNVPTTVNGSNVVEASPGNGACIVFDGGTGANTCCGSIMQAVLLHGSTWGPAAIEGRNCDSLEFFGAVINGGSNTDDGAINRRRKPGVRLNGSNTSDTFASRNNVFHGGSAGAGGINIMGVLNTAARLSAPANANVWRDYQMGNGEPIPVVEGNAYFQWSPNGGHWNPTVIAPVAIADQAISAATLTLITGSLVQVPPQGSQIGTTYRWKIHGTSAAAGTAANTIAVRYGVNGTTADAVVATVTTSVGTAAASEYTIEIELTIRTIGAAATAVCRVRVTNSGTTGFINTTMNVLNGTMSTFNTTTARPFFSVSLTTGASKTATIRQCTVECVKAANP